MANKGLLKKYLIWLIFAKLEQSLIRSFLCTSNLIKKCESKFLRDFWETCSKKFVIYAKDPKMRRFVNRNNHCVEISINKKLWAAILRAERALSLLTFRTLSLHKLFRLHFWHKIHILQNILFSIFFALVQSKLIQKIHQQWFFRLSWNMKRQ